MTKLVWDILPRRYEAGVDRGVFYPANAPGEAWNGLTSVQESSSGADEKTRYIDGLRTRSRRKPGDFEGTIEAYTYPDSFYENVLEPRRPKPFGLSYRTQTEDSYKIHVVYNVLLGPTGQVYKQQNDTDPFSWAFTTNPVAIPDARPTAHLVIEAGQAYSETTAALEDVLYGSDAAAAQLPAAFDILEIFEANSILRIIDHGDGSWTADGPADVIAMLDATSFQINWPSAVYISSDTYTIHSL